MEPPVDDEHPDDAGDARPRPPAWPGLDADDAPRPMLTRRARSVEPPGRKRPPGRGAIAVVVVLLALAGVGVWTTVSRQGESEEGVASRVEVSDARPGAPASAALLRDIGERLYEEGEHAQAYRMFRRLLAAAPGDAEAARYVERLEARMVVLKSEPPGAAVLRGDERLGETPLGLFPNGRAVRLRLELDDRPPRTIDVAPDARGELLIELPPE